MGVDAKEGIVVIAGFASICVASRHPAVERGGRSVGLLGATLPLPW